MFPSNVSDTLNVRAFSAHTWLNGEQGRYGLNSVHSTHNYHPLYGYSQTRNDLGNIGSAGLSTLFDYDRDFGFSFRPSRIGFWKGLKGREFLLSEKMFSNVQYSNGVNRENYLLANLTRSFGSLLDFGFRFNRINSEGFYDRQQNTITDFSIYSTFRSRDDRYKAVLMFEYSNLKVEENGGLAEDSVFEQDLGTGRNFVPISLSNASNHWKGFELGLDHRFVLLKSDSTSRKRKYLPAVSHSFIGGRNSMIYADVPDTSALYYESILLDSVITYDSTNLLDISNTLRFELLTTDSAKNKILNQVSVGVRHDYHRVSYDSSFVQHINNLSVVGGVNGRLFKNLDWNASGKFMFAGYNVFDFVADGFFKFGLFQSTFTAFVDYSLLRPDFIADVYTSNHFAWDNNWQKTQHLKTGLVYSQSRLRFKGTFTYHLLDNLVVFGTDRKPYQSASVNQLMVLRLEEHFRMRWFHLVFDVAGQLKLSGDDVRVPSFLGRGMFYYQNDLFKKKLRLQIGVETNYSTSYFGNAYNPALSAFHIQNEKQIGNYPFIDVFLNIRVKKLRAFFKIEHLNAGWLGYTYYQVPHYPANDLAWKFGINWAFLD
ncbi:MAG: putative porin [Flavobacteriales bacterium]